MTCSVCGKFCKSRIGLGRHAMISGGACETVYVRMKSEEKLASGFTLECGGCGRKFVSITMVFKKDLVECGAYDLIPDYEIGDTVQFNEVIQVAA